MEALKRTGKQMGISEATTWEYEMLIMLFPERDSIIKKIHFLHECLDHRKFDNKMKLEQQRIIMQNSIEVFEVFFKDLKENYNYQKYINEIEAEIAKKKEEIEKVKEKELEAKVENEKQKWKKMRSKESDKNKIGDHILENLIIKIQEDKELKKITTSMEKIEMNFYTEEKENFKIYPIVVDLLMDIVATEYTLSIRKNLIQANITEWKEAKEEQKEENSFSYVLFSKMELMEKVEYDRIRPYFLSEYARTLKLDKKELRRFMQHILYENVDNHKNSPSLDFDEIDDIPSRPFLLENTKMVIGGI